MSRQGSWAHLYHQCSQVVDALFFPAIAIDDKYTDFSTKLVRRVLQRVHESRTSLKLLCSSVGFVYIYHLKI
jgi:hypothetical protein